MARRAFIASAAAALVLAVAAPSLAQAPRTPRPAAKAAPQQPPAPPPIFPCRTAEEVCFLGIVVGPQVAVIYTNAANGQGIDEKALDVTGADGARIDMAKDEGRVVMLTGSYDPKLGLTGASVVEVASPLASLAVKAQLAGGPPEGAQPAPKAAAPRRR